MEAVFLKIVNMSLTASWLVLAVILLRVLFKKAPKALRCGLWALVGVRLVCPFSFESALSLIPSAQPIPDTITTDTVPTIDSGVPAVNAVVNPVLSQSFSPTPGDSVNPLQVLTAIAACVWLVGIAAMLIYAAVSFWRVRRQVSACLHLRDNVYLCDGLPSPFILGILRPRIYLPTGLDDTATAHILAHEQAHLRRRDHWFKPLGFLLLTVHWFNPVMWVAYILLCRDIELACDEKVARTLDEEGKATYSRTLLACGAHRRVIAACPLAFGEVGIKARVKSVLSYKKPTFWVILVALIASLAAAVGFLTNPLTTTNDQLKVFIDCQIADHFEYHKEGEENLDIARCIDWKLLGRKRNSDGTTLYMWVFYSEYSLQDNELQIESSAHIPTAITYKKESGQYKPIEYWEPRDGAYLISDIKEKFPWYVQRKALDSQRYIKTQKAACEDLAREHFGLSTVKTTPLDGDLPKTGLYELTERLCFLDSEIYPSSGDTDSAFALLIDNGTLYLYKNNAKGAIGKLEKFTLTRENFDSFFKNPDSDLGKMVWNTGGSAADLRKNTVNAWRYVTTEGHPCYYYILQMNNGDLLFCSGMSDTAIHNFLSVYTVDPVEGFCATVSEVYDAHLLVEPFEGEEIRRSASRIEVPTGLLSYPVPELHNGDQVWIGYDGEVQETYPARLASLPNAIITILGHRDQATTQTTQSTTKPDTCKVNPTVIVAIEGDRIIVDAAEHYVHTNDSRFSGYDRFAFDVSGIARIEEYAVGDKVSVVHDGSFTDGEPPLGKLLNLSHITE